VGGLEALGSLETKILERSKFLGQPGVGWDLSDQFTFDVEVSRHKKTTPTTATSVTTHEHQVTVSVEGEGVTQEAIYASGSGPAHTHLIEGFRVLEAHGTGQAPHSHDLISDFPELPLVLQKNAALVLQALDPTHTLYEYRNLFRETLRQVFADRTTEFTLSEYRYEDFRKDCFGFSGFSGTQGAVLTDRYLFRDITVSFRALRPGALLIVPNGANEGRYTVSQVQSFPYGDDPVARPYVTSPTGLTGTATVAGGALVDPAQNFGLAVVGEILTLQSGPNAGPYRLEQLLGLHGGPVGVPVAPTGTIGPATSVRPSISILRVQPKFPVSGGSVPYSVEVGRLGEQMVGSVVGEDVSLQFYSPGGPFSSFSTSYGPLVRVDGTPATKADLTVTLDGTPVTVSKVNPYTGLVTLATPVAGFSPGARVVLVSYRWLKTPIVGLTGLNVPGLTLNRWDLKRGRATTSQGTRAPGGGTRQSRFQMGVALGVHPRRRDPIRIAHRYVAFEKGYTASLNSPTTLRLNQAPGSFTVPYATVSLGETSVAYEPEALPQSPWTLVGTLSGSLEDGSYTLRKTSTTQVGYWKQDFPLPVSSVVGVGARFTLDSDSVTPDGVYTGVGFGFHNNRSLVYAGALVVRNPVSGVSLKHLGILARPGDLSEVSSWVVGPNATGTIQGTLGSRVLTVPKSSVPSLIKIGDRFQVLEGPQSGSYTLRDFYQSGDLVTFVVDPPFPANPQVWGNQEVTVLFEVDWGGPQSTWRLHAETSTSRVQLFFGGATGGTLSVSATPLASPASLGPDLLPEGSGRILWGSLSRRATATSHWSFLRAKASPTPGSSFTRGTVVDSTMGSLPEGDPWYLLTPFGDSALDGGSLRVTSTPAEEALGTLYGYGYTDPFLNGRRVASLEAKIRVSRDTSGAGGASLSLLDPYREVRLGTLLYRDVSPTQRVLYSQPTVSLVGSVGFESQGWSEVSGTAGFYPNGSEILLRDAGSDWEIHAPYTSSGAGRFLEFRLSVSSFTGGATGRIGLSFRMDLLGRSITVDFRSPNQVVLRSTATSTVLATYAVTWSDGLARTYRLEYDGSSLLTFYVNNSPVGSTVTLATFPTSTYVGVSVLCIHDGSSSFTASLQSFCMGGTPAGVAGLGKTFGIWLGGDPSNINNWKIPRSDSSSAPNSDTTNAVPVPMDWGSQCWVRVLVDPTFGATLVRPDLAPPPGYTGDFATESMDPSAGWVAVDYSKLPRRETSGGFGQAKFGALNPSSSTVQWWDDVRYRVFTYTSANYRAPQKMTLNRWNVITSGDYLKDSTPEEVVVSSVTETRVSLRPCGIFAGRVFMVLVEGVPRIPGTWHFNQDTQEILLDTPLPSRNYPVGVVFAPRLPVTREYLKTQPLLESQTILNEGTPPVPRGQVGRATLVTVSGDGGSSPEFPPAGPSNPNYFLRDPYLVQTFEDEAQKLYEQMEFFELPDGGQRGSLTPFCDGGMAVGVSFSGPTFTEDLHGMGASDRGRGPGGYRTVLHASGGTQEILGLLGPAVYTTPFTNPNPAPNGLEPSMLYPSGPSQGVVPGSDQGAVYRELFWVLQLGASPGSVLSQAESLPYTNLPLEENFEGMATDQWYASNGPGALSPSVSGSPNGTAWYGMTYFSEIPRVGPWTGYPGDLTLLYGTSALQPTGEPAPGLGFLPQGGSIEPDTPAPVVGTL
jgi:hypothetical protein